MHEALFRQEVPKQVRMTKRNKFMTKKESPQVLDLPLVISTDQYTALIKKPCEEQIARLFIKILFPISIDIP
ncbi:hypothetical protein [Desertivirga xinjiangensis]|uniref:hypothetical protein n=1 Tax=Desertivirga xinjiangensis TaxID=539206 RepID=UPI00210EEC9B|nr:hypothetical protein [Pedobacter xinjiangensis]